MVFVKFLLDKTHKYHIHCKKFFKDIESQKHIGVTSSFTRTEYLAVMKELVARTHGNIASQSEIQDAMNILDEFMNRMGIEYFDSDDLIVGFKDFFSSCHRHVELTNPVEGIDKKWRSLGGADSIVLLMAERCNSDYIATNDDGFKRISSRVMPMLLKEQHARI